MKSSWGSEYNPLLFNLVNGEIVYRKWKKVEMVEESGRKNSSLPSNLVNVRNDLLPTISFFSFLPSLKRRITHLTYPKGSLMNNTKKTDIS